jgi:Na+/H+-dicarboxylate symporter
LRDFTVHLQGLVRSRLWLQILVGMFLGVGVGLLLGPSTGLVPPDTGAVLADWVAVPGNVFLTVIQMIIIPLVFASVVLGIAASDDPGKLRKVGLRVVFYFLFTTAFAVTIGIGITSVVRPGDFISRETVDSIVARAEVPKEALKPGTSPSFSDIPKEIVKILPKNPFISMVGGNMLQIVLFAIFIGVALVSLKAEQARPLLDLLSSLQEVCLKVVRWAMLIAPLAVFGLLAQITAKVGLDVLLGMGVYVGTVLGGLLILVCFYLIIVLLVSGRSPWNFLAKVRGVQLLAFSTSSSAAVMPVTMEVAEDELDVKPAISRFLIPLGTTVNMEGTALYQGAATVFLAQTFGVDLSLGALVLVVVTAVGASIGTPATPGVGIIVLAMVLETAGIPTSGIALIIGVDRILDMSRTAVNVTGDLTACTVMNRWVGGSNAANLK